MHSSRDSGIAAIASDGVLLLLIALAFPLAVLIVDTPVALLARLLFEVVRH